jgi:hypothetical protein
MRVGAISPSGEQLALARCLVINGFFPKASLFVGAASKTGGTYPPVLLGRRAKLVDTCDKDFWEPLVLPIGSVRPASKGTRVNSTGYSPSASERALPFQHCPRFSRNP